MTNSLQQMSQRREAWLNEKPGFSGGNELRLRSGSEAYVHFVTTGEDGDRFIKIYRDHSFDIINAQGKRSNPHRYCLLKNGDGPECPYCQMGHDSIKERMSIWFYVYYIAHKTMPANTAPDKMLPMFQDSDGTMKYKEDVNDFRVWHSSAWRESPWSDILKLSEMYKGTNKFVAQLTCNGDGLARRFKVYALPTTPALSDEAYATAMQTLTPIPQMLMDQLASPVAWNPTAPPPAQPIQNQQAPQPGIIAFNPAGAFTQPQAQAPTTTAPPTFSFVAPAAAPPAQQEEQVPTNDPTPPWENKQPAAPAPVVEAPAAVVETPAPPVAEAPKVEAPVAAPAAPSAPPAGAPLRKLF